MQHVKRDLKKRNVCPGKIQNKRFSPKTETEKKTDFTLKFEKAKVKCFHVQLPFDIIDDPVLNVNARAVFIELERRAWPKDICCPTITQLEKQTGLGRRSIYSSLKLLKKYRFIYWKATRSVNIYLLIWKNADPEKRLAQFKDTRSDWLLRIVGKRIDSPLPMKNRSVKNSPSRRRNSFP